jgi:signal transduction histidine kinase
MSDEKVNCWQEMQCGREPGGARAGEQGPCPAATDTTCDGINDGKNAGRLCWVVAGTLCGGQTQGTREEKLERCQSCSFFRRVKYEQGCHFQLIEPGLGTSDPVQLHRLLNNVVMLLGVCRDVFACLAVHPLLSAIAEHAAGVTRASSAAAYLLDGSGEQLVLEAHVGPASRPERVALDEDTPVAEAARTRRFCKGSAAIPGCPDPAVAAAVPIGGRNRFAGALELLKTDGEFSLDDEWFLREFSLMAALGVENARQVEDLRQLKRFDKAKSRFVALLMHHITSPLATIACSLQALSQIGEGLKGEDRDKLIQYSMERITSIQALSKKLLDLAAIRRGSSLVEIRPVLPAEPLRQEVNDRLARARESGVEITMTQRGTDAPVLADPSGLRLIFGNLLSNAVKYSTGAQKKVDVELTTGGGRARVSIRDRGIGIPAEEQAKVFDEFHRGSNVAGTGPSGFGLGLAIVKELVDRYNGRISLESEVGAGTTVRLELPTVDQGEPGDHSS